MAKYDKISPETQQEAMKIARANQKPGQTKEQTQLIAQGIQKGVDEYKKQMKARAREASRQKKLQAKAKQPQQGEHEEETHEIELIEVSRQHPLPWILLLLSWLGFAAAWFWLR
ncbi:Protein of uncharacterised function (DUF2956) [Aeromonas encheleia]|uniref:DUF2956 domain-containing protein n=1 Tax=Aeromonas encheleia TaxID=73010 RepID=A0AAE9SBY1_9GAMM|nr:MULTISPECIES: DUF2956 domain-containing protein [Aeromonas]MBV7415959.1 DUF2956 domain-containing protein [Aeromonas sp. sif2433]MBV7597408.1 DUF2956 domain-containing protein [Aeromonas sp. sia0103]UNP89198.1 DUF2956 domain-containing protein [Aeromonas encheleia]USV56856.1 DUF2956 domain-containing protein [Aeromonas encheleia]VEG97753.1 Protein of uncharacterised function (DUF2956) [Aeromonas encheleia]